MSRGAWLGGGSIALALAGERFDGIRGAALTDGKRKRDQKGDAISMTGRIGRQRRWTCDSDQIRREKEDEKDVD